MNAYFTFTLAEEAVFAISLGIVLLILTVWDKELKNKGEKEYPQTFTFITCVMVILLWSMGLVLLNFRVLDMLVDCNQFIPPAQ